MTQQSKLEEVLRTERTKVPDEKTPLKSALEQELDGEDTELVKELHRTKAEELIARRRMAINQMRGIQTGSETGGGKVLERGKEWLTDIAQGLLERGLDPAVVGRTIDYLMGAGQFPHVGVPGAAAPAGGMSFTDMMAFYKVVQESNKTDPALTAILTKLVEKVDAIEKRPVAPAALPQKSFLLVKADGSILEVEAGKPIILEPKPVRVEGESLEVVKERNRHEEEMLSRKGQITHNKNLSDTMAEIPESILAIAATATSKGQEKPGAVASTMLYKKCETDGCGFDIPYPPEATHITCPKCREGYDRKAEVS